VSLWSEIYSFNELINILFLCPHAL
jgi:hypothetical protein